MLSGTPTEALVTEAMLAEAEKLWGGRPQVVSTKLQLWGAGEETEGRRKE